MPPEAFKVPAYSSKIDIFSTGVLVVQIITCRFPEPTARHMPVKDPKHKDPIFVCLSVVQKTLEGYI